MPTYVFSDEVTGELVELFMPVEECVPLGETRTIDGRLLRRLVVAPEVAIQPGFGHVAWGLSRDESRIAAPRDRDGKPRVDHDGHAVFANRNEIEEGNAKLRAAGSSSAYDFGVHAKTKKRKALK